MDKKQILERKINWEVPTLWHAIDRGERIPESIFTNKNQYICPKCTRNIGNAIQLTDIRSMPHLEYDFVCDGCVSNMERHCVDVDGDGVPEDPFEWRIKWIKMLGAPDEMIEKMTRKNNRFEVLNDGDDHVIVA